jgi:hypothetical protein
MAEDLGATHSSTQQAAMLFASAKDSLLRSRLPASGAPSAKLEQSA